MEKVLVLSCSELPLGVIGAFVRTEVQILSRPGSIRDLLWPENSLIFDELIKEISVPANLCQVSRVLLISHEGCTSFASQVERELVGHFNNWPEYALHFRKLREAREMLRVRIDIPVDIAFAFKNDSGLSWDIKNVPQTPGELSDLRSLYLRSLVRV